MIDLEKFIAIRKKKKISQAELAKGICTQATLSNFESGKKFPLLKFWHCSVKDWILKLAILSSTSIKPRLGAI
ncbi:hypothetical protein B1745_05975 [Lactobacillus amylolyticus]|uniref:helix-turn-helix domain-containing protein n=1 Tax=Lactobacillus amylolyticus TaxID=83683 RepID=UPI00031B639E|nr:helix-turn-helix transcriptional regulator [Lactobacillus amylolyticus]ARD07153.1 hypothetical protein B1745_05975 [Lactobacillus amylolyticus]